MNPILRVKKETIEKACHAKQITFKVLRSHGIYHQIQVIRSRYGCGRHHAMRKEHSKDEEQLEKWRDVASNETRYGMKIITP